MLKKGRDKLSKFNIMSKIKKKVGAMPNWLFWTFVWVMGIAGQLCWNMENQWFNTFVYAKIGGDVNIVTAMVIVSAIVTTISTFVFGTLSDRMGKRKRFVSIGYILWGITTIIFGLTEFIRQSNIGSIVFVSAFLVVLTDAIMSFFGSMGNDSGYSTWLNDHTNEENKGKIGAALAALPVFGTVVGTVLGGMLVNVGNPTVSDPNNYNPALDNYQLLFGLMGGFVILVGIISLFFLKDAPSTTPYKNGTFFRQLSDAFNFKKLKGNENNKEMLLASLVACFFFIPFNFYFVHMGNWMIYDIGFTASNMGLVEGISLLLAVVLTIPFSKMIEKNKTPLLVFLAIFVNAIGLLLTFLLIKSPNDVDSVNLFSAKNIPLFLCVFLIGLGYVLIMQACMIWTRGLFPKECRGQFEGIRVCFFTLIPMFIGTLIGNLIIKLTPQDTPIYDVYNHVIDVPQENLFLYAAILVLLAFIPLYFASKLYLKRIRKEKEELPCNNESLEENTSLLDNKGNLNIHGFAPKFIVNYNRDKICKRSLTLKEWNFYQVISGDYSIQLTVGHLSYIANLSFTVINLKNGEKKSSSMMIPLTRFDLDLNPEKPSKFNYNHKDIEVSLEVTESKRILKYKANNVSASLELDNDLNNEKMVIATSFDKKKQFYLNYKENYYRIKGNIKFDDLELNFDNATGLLDWGRGRWPYSHRWVWGSLSTYVDNIPFGLNIGYGFGDLTHATENVFFYDKKAYKLSKLLVEKDDNDYLKPWSIKDENNLINLTFTPIYDNYTQNKFVIISTSCHQVYGYFKGTFIVDGKEIELKESLGFIEQAKNRW